ncbi:MAG: S-layer homology domain-containing protein [Bacillaceae bacterium]|nr:S-layer homology domain-containing protein [Bacillaceae bacterium]
MRKAIILAALLMTYFVVPASAYAESGFKDVPVTYWAYHDIQKLADHGLIKISEEDSFYPDQQITRAEVSVFIARLLELDFSVIPKNHVYSDVPPDFWAYDEIYAVNSLKLFSNHAEKTFKPYELVTRSQAVEILDQIFLLPDTETNIFFRDVPESHQSYDTIQRFAGNGIVYGYPDESFHPDDPITRAQFAAMLSRLWNHTKKARKIPILLYHHILQEGENDSFLKTGSVVSLEDFEKQMKYLYQNGYQTISQNELHAFLKGEMELPHKSILITFDDGLKSNAHYAYSILKKYKFTALEFMITGRIQDETEAFDPYKLQFLSHKEMESIKDVFEYGSHTHGLHRLKGKKGYMLIKSQDQVKADILSSYRFLHQPVSFSYPFGQYKPDHIDLLKEIGFKMAFTIEKGYAEQQENPYALPRFSITSRTPYEDFLQYVNYYKYY